MAEYKINYTQSNFTGGIIAAELYGRNDFNKVKTGLKKCTNWTIREAGGLEFRRGTRYLQTIPVAEGTNFKMASLDSMLLFFCSDGIRYLDSQNAWQLIAYPTDILPNLDKLQFTELKRRLYYYDGNIKLCEVVLNSGIPSTKVSIFEVSPVGATCSAEVVGTLPNVYVLTEHEYTFSLAKDSAHEGIYAYKTLDEGWAPVVYNSNLGNNNWNCITYGQDKFIALGYYGHISTSADGATWTQAVQDSNLSAHMWEGLAYWNGKFVALGYGGYISTSTDGTTWTAATQNANLGSNSWEAIAYGNGKFVALGDEGYVSTSTDGITWTTASYVSNLGNNSWAAIAYGNGKFVALGYGGYISTSANGTTWSVATTNENLNSNRLNNISYGNGKFIACTSDGFISTSIDGITWTPLTRNTNLGGNYTWTSITYSPLLQEFFIIENYGHISFWRQTSSTIVANVELTRANSDSDGKGQQVNVTVKLTNNQATEYNRGKIYVYKKYQGEFYFLTALDIIDGTTEYKFEDQGILSVDVSKTPKANPGYIEQDGSIKSVNSIADYNQRVFLTRSNNDVTQIIFSAVGQTDTFAYSGQRSETEGGNLELPISNYDSWCKVVSGLDLILSTSYTINKVSGYGDLQTETVLWDGLSKSVDPVRTRRSLIYTNGSNRNIYDLTYNEYGQYDSIDLTLLVKYIFEEKTIKRLAFKDYPVKTIYVLCSDGELYCLTYIKDQNIYAWYKIEHEGIIKDICVINKDTEDELFVVVNYDGTYIIENAYQRTDNVYLDCAVIKQLSDITDNEITGLGIFEGKKVRVFDAGNNLYYGDYDVMNPKTVVEGGKTVEIDDLNFDGYLVVNGSIQLPEDIELVGPIIVGLPYYAVMETIPLEFQDQNGNSTIGRKKAVNEAYLRYGDSRGISYKTMGHEYDCEVCARDVADNAQFLERGQVKLHTVSEYKWDSTIKILQRQPYPARIESITLGLTFNDKS